MYHKVAKDSNKGRTIIFQAVVMKVLGIDAATCCGANKKFPWLFDIMHDRYGRIDIKYSSATRMGCTERYTFQTNRRVSMEMVSRRECDTYFFLGCHNGNIEDIYIIPNSGWIKSISAASIKRNTDDSKYNEFRTDAKPYNDAYRSLMLFVGSNVMVGIDDIKDWLSGRPSMRREDDIVKNEKVEYV